MINDPKELKTCSICQQDYIGWGNNAEPVNEGRCCDMCNSAIVVPARIVMFYKRRAKETA